MFTEVMFLIMLIVLYTKMFIQLRETVTRVLEYESSMIITQVVKDQSTNMRIDCAKQNKYKYCIKDMFSHAIPWDCLLGKSRS